MQTKMAKKNKKMKSMDNLMLYRIFECLKKADLKSESSRFEAFFWTEKAVRDYTGDTRETIPVVINKNHFYVHEGTEHQGYFLGLAGRKVTIQISGRIVKSNNVWHQGEIPEVFMPLFEAYIGTEIVDETPQDDDNPF